MNPLVAQNDNDFVDTLVPIGDFEFNDQTLRAFHIDGTVWFVAADVGKILNLTNIRVNLRSLDNADVSTAYISSGSQFKKHTVINKPGSSQLIFQSRKPEAKSFRRWVAEFVRNNGCIWSKDESARHLNRGLMKYE